MNNNVKHVVIFLLGAGLGALVANKMLKSKYEQLVDAEVEVIRAFYKEEFDYLEDSNMTDHVKVFKPASKEKEVVDYNAITKLYGNVTAKKDISTVMRERGLIPASELDNEEVVEEEEEYESMPIAPRNNDDPIHIIEENSFFNECEHYDKLTVTYYEADNTLADERDGIIPSPEDIVGVGTLSGFDTNVMYVRNHKITTDFEIIRSVDGYYETVLGVIPPKTPVKVNKTPRTRKKVTDGEI